MGTDPGQSKIPQNLENQNMSPGNRYPSFSVASNKQEPENKANGGSKHHKKFKRERMGGREKGIGPSWLLVYPNWQTLGSVRDSSQKIKWRVIKEDA